MSDNSYNAGYLDALADVMDVLKNTMQAVSDLENDME